MQFTHQSCHEVRYEAINGSGWCSLITVRFLNEAADLGYFSCQSWHSFHFVTGEQ